jgi:hypothetical protein
VSDIGVAGKGGEARCKVTAAGYENDGFTYCESGLLDPMSRGRPGESTVTVAVIAKHIGEPLGDAANAVPAKCDGIARG